ncbi:MFS transporter [Phaeocystidibacter luteus]|uniref:MFS transporter n=1 Tax=Phaeocystidibacter luteus TaxID=911197 RepID=A0A6N6RFH3_9FLAO|nr:MFS transporter [Phaeocystidibacter luteus]KAB2807295.1 MFS transporter [Phaeocystidibacter luteus]
MKPTDKSTYRAWAFYDWANSAYSLVISTAIFPIYYGSVTSNDNGNILNVLGWEVESTAIYAWVIALSFLTVAIISPYLSALADLSGRKRDYMRNFVILGSISCMSMYFFTENTIVLGLAAAFFASLGFSGSLVFYNAYLPQIAPPEDQDKLSARGFSLGYIGSSLLLIALLALISYPEALGLAGKGQATQIAFVTVGLWWLGWSMYPLRVLPHNIYGRKPEKGWAKNAYKELAQVFGVFRKTKRLGRFVISFFFFSCGVQTTILLATMFGKEVLDVDDEILIGTVLIIQFVGILGAWSFAQLSSKIGNIKAIAVAVFIWVAVCIAAYFVQTTTQFMIIGGVVGLVMGGVQALARSTYSKMLPETKDHTTFFSFYDVAEKLATTLGTFSVGILVAFTGDLRNSALALTAFFLISLIFLFAIPKSKYVY